MQQVAVGGMNLHHVEAGLQRPPRRLDKGVHDRVDAGKVQRQRGGIGLGKGHGAGGDGLPAALGVAEKMLAVEGNAH